MRAVALLYFVVFTRVLPSIAIYCKHALGSSGTAVNSTDCECNCELVAKVLIPAIIRLQYKAEEDRIMSPRLELSLLDMDARISSLVNTRPINTVLNTTRVGALLSDNFIMPWRTLAVIPPVVCAKVDTLLIVTGTGFEIGEEHACLTAVVSHAIKSVTSRDEARATCTAAIRVNSSTLHCSIAPTEAGSVLRVWIGAPCSRKAIFGLSREQGLPSLVTIGSRKNVSDDVLDASGRTDGVMIEVVGLLPVESVVPQAVIITADSDVVVVTSEKIVAGVHIFCILQVLESVARPSVRGGIVLGMNTVSCPVSKSAGSVLCSGALLSRKPCVAHVYVALSTSRVRAMFAYTETMANFDGHRTIDKRSSIYGVQMLLLPRTPHVETCAPLFGSAEGSTTVVCNGTGFSISTRPTCRFGDQWSSARVRNATHLECDAPPVVSRQLYENDVNSIISRREFDFAWNGIDLLRLGGGGLIFTAIHSGALAWSAMPARGPASGGTPVYISTDIHIWKTIIPIWGHIACRFGDNTVDASIISETTILCVAPPRPRNDSEFGKPIGVHLALLVHGMSHVLHTASPALIYVYDATVVVEPTLCSTEFRDVEPRLLILPADITVDSFLLDKVTSAMHVAISISTPLVRFVTTEGEDVGIYDLNCVISWRCQNAIETNANQQLVSVSGVLVNETAVMCPLTVLLTRLSRLCDAVILVNITVSTGSQMCEDTATITILRELLIVQQTLVPHLVAPSTGSTMFLTVSGKGSHILTTNVTMALSCSFTNEEPHFRADVPAYTPHITAATIRTKLLMNDGHDFEVSCEAPARPRGSCAAAILITLWAEGLALSAPLRVGYSPDYFMASISPRYFVLPLQHVGYITSPSRNLILSVMVVHSTATTGRCSRDDFHLALDNEVDDGADADDDVDSSVHQAVRPTCVIGGEIYKGKVRHLLASGSGRRAVISCAIFPDAMTLLAANMDMTLEQGIASVAVTLNGYDALPPAHGFALPVLTFMTLGTAAVWTLPPAVLPGMHVIAPINLGGIAVDLPDSALCSYHLAVASTLTGINDSYTMQVVLSSSAERVPEGFTCRVPSSLQPGLYSLVVSSGITHVPLHDFVMKVTIANTPTVTSATSESIYSNVITKVCLSGSDLHLALSCRVFGAVSALDNSGYAETTEGKIGFAASCTIPETVCRVGERSTLELVDASEGLGSASGIQAISAFEPIRTAITVDCLGMSPVVSGATPQRLPVNVTTFVYIAGQGLASYNTCTLSCEDHTTRMDEIKIIALWANDTSVICAVPAPAQPCALVLQLLNEEHVVPYVSKSLERLRINLECYEPLRLVAFSPAIVSEDGGTNVHIRTSGLPHVSVAAASCIFQMCKSAATCPSGINESALDAMLYATSNAVAVRMGGHVLVCVTPPLRQFSTVKLSIRIEWLRRHDDSYDMLEVAASNMLTVAPRPHISSATPESVILSDSADFIEVHFVGDGFGLWDPLACRITRSSKFSDPNSSDDGSRTHSDFPTSVTPATIDRHHSGRVTCTVHHPMPPGVYFVYLIRRHGSHGPLFVHRVRVVQQWTIISATPLVGASTGGTTIIMRGDVMTFRNETWCRFGGTSVLAVLVESNAVSCTSPPLHRVALDPSLPILSYGRQSASIIVPLAVTNDGGLWQFLSPGFTYVDSPVVDMVLPIYGSELGGTVVTVTGTDFIASSELSCNFGSILFVPARFVSSTTLICTSPVRPPSSVHLAVANDGVNIGTSRAIFTFLAVVTVVTAYPSQGSTVGGTIVTLRGTGFSLAPLLCRFGSAGIVRSIAVNDTTIFCTSPATGSVGRINLGVSHNGVDYADSIAHFTFVRGDQSERGLVASPKLAHAGVTILQWLPSVESVGIAAIVASPSLDKHECHFCDNALAHSVSSDCTNIRSPHVTQASMMIFMGELVASCPVPADNSSVYGTWSARLVKSDCEKRQSACIRGTTSIGITPKLHIMAVVPRAMYEGEAPILLDITGTGFAPTSMLACRLGTIVARALFISSARILCRILIKVESSATVVDKTVSVTMNGIDYFAAGRALIVAPHPVVNSQATVIYSPRRGGARILVHGGDFIDEERHACNFQFHGDIVSGGNVDAVVVDATTVSCVVPPLPGAQSLPFSAAVMLQLLHTQFDTGISIVYVNEAHLIESRPITGSMAGGTLVTVRGSGWDHSVDAACRFGANDEVRAYAINTTHLQCHAPPAPQWLFSQHQPYVVALTIVLSGNAYLLHDGAESGLTFAYIDDAVVEYAAIFSPCATDIQHGQNVVVIGTGFDTSAATAWSCKYGSGPHRDAISVTRTAVTCPTPQLQGFSGTVTISSNGGVDEFTAAIRPFDPLQMAYPLTANRISGPTYGGVAVLIKGTAVAAAPMLSSLTCTFGEEQDIYSIRSNNSVAGTRLNQVTILCLPPAHAAGLVVLRILASSLVGGYQKIQLGALPFTFTPTIKLTGISPRVLCRARESQVMIFINNGSAGSAEPLLSTPAWHAACIISSSGNEKIVAAEPRPSLHHYKCVVPLSIDDTALFIVLRIWYPIRHESAYFKSDGIARNLPNMIHGMTHQPEDAYFDTPRKVIHVVPPPRAVGLFPVFGIATGGNRVRVTGTGFHHALHLTCVFGTASVTATAIDENTVECVAPTLHVCIGVGGKGSAWPLPVSFVVLSSDNHNNTNDDFVEINQCIYPTTSSHDGLRNGTSRTSTVLLYYYFDISPISLITPNSGRSQGGTIIIVIGSGFFKSAGNVPVMWLCGFGATSVSATVINNTAVACAAPAQIAAGGYHSVPVIVFPVDSFIGAAQKQVAPHFTYIDRAPGIAMLVPAAGLRGGNTSIKVYFDADAFNSNARGLPHGAATNVIACRFGSVSVRAITQNISIGGEVTCVSPPLAALMATSVVRLGCMVDTSSCFSTRTDVSISYDGSDWGETAHFVYHDTPHIDYVQPTHVSEDGGAILSLVGYHFINSTNLSCLIGATTRVTATFVSATTVQCVAPQMPYSLLHGPSLMVTIVRDDSTAVYATSTASVTYVYRFFVNSVFPSHGSREGGSDIVLHGGPFEIPSEKATSLYVCLFGTHPYSVSQIARVASTSTLTCKTPLSQSAAGSVPIRVCVTDLGMCSEAIKFIYVNWPEVLAIHPMHGPASRDARMIFQQRDSHISISPLLRDGLVTVTLRGQNLTPQPPLTAIDAGDGQIWCRFGTAQPSRVRTVNDTTALCDVPGATELGELLHDEVMSLRLATSIDGAYFRETVAVYTVDVPPLVVGGPSGLVFVRDAGGSFVRFSVTRRPAESRISCNVDGGIQWKAEVECEHSLLCSVVCYVPPHPIGALTLWMTIGDQPLFAAGQHGISNTTLIVIATPRVAHVDPSFVIDGCGTVVMIIGASMPPPTVQSFCTWSGEKSQGMRITSAHGLNSTAIACALPALDSAHMLPRNLFVGLVLESEMPSPGYHRVTVLPQLRILELSPHTVPARTAVIVVATMAISASVSFVRACRILNGNCSVINRGSGNNSITVNISAGAHYPDSLSVDFSVDDRANFAPAHVLSSRLLVVPSPHIANVEIRKREPLAAGSTSTPNYFIVLQGRNFNLQSHIESRCCWHFRRLDGTQQVVETIYSVAVTTSAIRAECAIPDELLGLPLAHVRLVSGIDDEFSSPSLKVELSHMLNRTSPKGNASVLVQLAAHPSLLRVGATAVITISVTNSHAATATHCQWNISTSQTGQGALTKHEGSAPAYSTVRALHIHQPGGLNTLVRCQLPAFSFPCIVYVTLRTGSADDSSKLLSQGIGVAAVTGDEYGVATIRVKHRPCVTDVIPRVVVEESQTRFTILGHHFDSSVIEGEALACTMTSTDDAGRFASVTVNVTDDTLAHCFLSSHLAPGAYALTLGVPGCGSHFGVFRVLQKLTTTSVEPATVSFAWPTDMHVCGTGFDASIDLRCIIYAATATSNDEIQFWPVVQVRSTVINSTSLTCSILPAAWKTSPSSAIAYAVAVVTDTSSDYLYEVSMAPQFTVVATSAVIDLSSRRLPVNARGALRVVGINFPVGLAARCHIGAAIVPASIVDAVTAFCSLDTFAAQYAFANNFHGASRATSEILTMEFTESSWGNVVISHDDSMMIRSRTNAMSIVTYQPFTIIETKWITMNGMRILTLIAEQSAPFPELTGYECVAAVSTHTVNGAVLVQAVRWTPWLLACTSFPMRIARSYYGATLNGGRDVGWSAIIENITAFHNFVAVHEQVEIESMSPRIGPICGGTLIIVVGRNFNGRSFNCIWGELRGGPARILDESHAECTSPPRDLFRASAVLTLYDIHLEKTVRVLSPISMNFTWIEAVKAAYVEPAFISGMGDTNITVVLMAVDEAIDQTMLLIRLRPAAVSSLYCTTEMVIPVKPTSISGRLYFVLPSLQAFINDSTVAEALELDVSFDSGQSYSGAPVHLYVSPLPNITAIVPNVVPDQGGTTIRVFTTVADPHVLLACAFLNKASSVTWTTVAQYVSQNEVTCITPVSAPGVGTIRLLFNGQIQMGSGVEIEFYPVVTLATIVPTVIYHAGTPLELTGTNFPTDDVACRFSWPVAAYVPQNHMNSRQMIGNTMNSDVMAIVSSSTTMSCNVPLLPAYLFHYNNVKVNVDILIHGISTAKIPTSITLTTFPSVLSVFPAVIQVDDVDSSTSLSLLVKTKNIPYYRGNADPLWCYFDGKRARPSRLLSQSEYQCDFSLDYSSNRVAIDGGVIISTTIHVGLGSASEMPCDTSRNDFTRLLVLPAPSTFFIEPRIVRSGVNGITLNVHGANFVEGDMAIAIGSVLVVRGSAIVHISSKELRVALPVLISPGRYDVVVTNAEFHVGRSNSSAVVDQSTTAALTVVDDVIVLAISPTSGPLSGGTDVTVNTTMLGVMGDAGSSLYCIFDSTPVQAQIASSTTLHCESPPSTRANSTVNVHIEQRWPSSFSAALEGKVPTIVEPQRLRCDGVALRFSYEQPVVVYSVRLSKGNFPAGYVDILGINFVNSSMLTVLFGAILAENVTFVSPTLMRVAAPHVTAVKLGCEEGTNYPTPVLVRVATNGADYGVSSAVFVHSLVGQANYATPHTIVAGVSTRITLHGECFPRRADFVCRFDGYSIPSPAEWVSASQIRCMTPQLRARPLTTLVSVGIDSESNTADNSFTVGTVQRGHPSNAELRILPEISVVTMLSEPIISASGHDILAFALSAPLPQGFRATCCIGPFPAEVLPLGFNTTTVVSIDATVDAFAVASCRMPTLTQPQSLGIYIGVRIQFGFGTSVSDDSEVVHFLEVPVQFTRILVLSSLIYSLSPRSGPSVGSTLIRIVGTNIPFNASTLLCVFSPLAEFNDASAVVKVDATFVSPELLLCIVPALSSVGFEIDNIVRVSVTVGGTMIRSADAALTFRYYRDFNVFNFSPHFIALGKLDSGTRHAITVYGEHFAIGPTIFCRFGTTIVVQARDVSSTRLVCDAPALQVAAVLLVAISQNGVDWQLCGNHSGCSGSACANNDSGSHLQEYNIDKEMRNASYSSLIGSADRLRYVAAAYVETISPSLGSIAGGTQVTLRGAGFDAESHCNCQVWASDGRTTGSGQSAMHTVPATFVSSSELVCRMPPCTVGDALVTLVNRADDQSATVYANAFGMKFQYTPAATIVEQAIPTAGQLRGGSQVVLRGGPFTNQTVYYCSFSEKNLDPAIPVPQVVVKAIWRNATDIVCFSPPWAAAHRNASKSLLNLGVVLTDIQLCDSMGKGACAYGTAQFAYFELPILAAVVPRQGVATGGVDITILASNFPQVLAADVVCRFTTNEINVVDNHTHHHNKQARDVHGKYVTNSNGDSGAIQCQTPALIPQSEVQLVIVSDGAFPRRRVSEEAYHTAEDAVSSSEKLPSNQREVVQSLIVASEAFVPEVQQLRFEVPQHSVTNNTYYSIAFKGENPSPLISWHAPLYDIHRAILAAAPHWLDMSHISVTEVAPLYSTLTTYSRTISVTYNGVFVVPPLIQVVHITGTTADLQEGAFCTVIRSQPCILPPVQDVLHSLHGIGVNLFNISDAFVQFTHRGVATRLLNIDSPITSIAAALEALSTIGAPIDVQTLSTYHVPSWRIVFTHGDAYALRDLPLLQCTLVGRQLGDAANLDVLLLSRGDAQPLTGAVTLRVPESSITFDVSVDASAADVKKAIEDNQLYAHFMEDLQPKVEVKRTVRSIEWTISYVSMQIGSVLPRVLLDLGSAQGTGLWASFTTRSAEVVDPMEGSTIEPTIVLAEAHFGPVWSLSLPSTPFPTLLSYGASTDDVRKAIEVSQGVGSAVVTRAAASIGGQPDDNVHAYYVTFTGMGIPDNVDQLPLFEGYGMNCTVTVSRIQSPCCTLAVSFNGGVDFVNVSADSSPLVFRPENHIVIHALVPSYGPASGGTPITVHAHGLLEGEHYSCVFGQAVSSVPGLRLNSSALSCTTPHSNSDSPHQVVLRILRTNSLSPSESSRRVSGLSNNNFGWDTNSGSTATFTYTGPLSIIHVVPSSGALEGGTPLTIVGEGFMPTITIAQCRFKCADATIETIWDVQDRTNHSVLVAAIIIDKTTASCISPPVSVLRCEVGDARTFHAWITVTVDKGDTYAQNTLHFTYAAQAGIISVVPARGPYVGGTLMTVHGTNFRATRELGCMFGNVFASGTFINEVSMQCVAPPRGSPAGEIWRLDTAGTVLSRSAWLLSVEQPDALPHGMHRVFTFTSCANVEPRVVLDIGTIVKDAAAGALAIGRAAATALGLRSVEVTIITAPRVTNWQGRTRASGMKQTGRTTSRLRSAVAKLPLGTTAWLLVATTRTGTTCTLDITLGTVEADLSVAPSLLLAPPNMPVVALAEQAVQRVRVRLQVVDDGGPGVIVPQTVSISARVAGEARQNSWGSFMLSALSGVNVSVDVNASAIEMDLAIEQSAGAAAGDVVVIRSTVTSEYATAIVWTVLFPPELGDLGPAAVFVSPSTSAMVTATTVTRGTYAGLSGNLTICVSSYCTEVSEHATSIEISTEIHAMIKTVSGMMRSPSLYSQLEWCTKDEPNVTALDAMCETDLALGHIDPIVACKRWIIRLPIGFSASIQLLAATPATTTSATLIKPQFSDTVSISVTNNGVDYGISFNFTDVRYTYYEPPALDKNIGLAPMWGPETGGTNISIPISGIAFTAANAESFNPMCRFDGIDVPAIVKSQPQCYGYDGASIGSIIITCASPPHIVGNVVVEISANGGGDFSSVATFTYRRPAHAARMFPRFGPIRGGTSIVLSLHHTWPGKWGQGSNDQLADPQPWAPLQLLLARCRFTPLLRPFWYRGSPMTHQNATLPIDEPAFTVATVTESGRSVMCSAPPAVRLGAVVVDIATNGVDFTGGGPVYQYKEELAVIQLAPQIGASVGGTIVYVSGVFGLTIGSPANLRSWSSIHELPAERDDWNDDQQQAQAYKIDNNYLHNLVSAGLRCSFGGITVAGTVVDTSIVRCISPPLHLQMPTTVTVEVTTNGQDYTSSGIRFAYVDLPVAVAVVPHHGPLVGGTLVSVVGRNFGDTGINRTPGSSLVCVFGDECIGDTIFVEAVLNSTVLICRTPRSARVGDVAVRIELATSIAAAKIQCHTNIDRFENRTTPRTAMHPAGSSPTLAATFRYDTNLHVRTLEPPLGSTLGGTEIRLVGSGFLPTVKGACRIGLISASLTPLHWVDDSTAVCITAPSQVERSMPIAVTLNGADYYETDLRFEYIAPIVLDYLFPVSGPAASSGTLITILGSGFLDSAYLSCRFGDVSVPAIFISSRTVQCTTPPTHSRNLAWQSLATHQTRNAHPSTGSLQLFPRAHSYPFFLSRLLAVEVSNNGQDFSDSGLHFLAQADAVVVNISTAGTGHDDDIAPLFVTGTGFVNSSLLRCMVGTASVLATFLTPELVMCVPPPGCASSLFVEVANNGVDFTMDQNVFVRKGPCPTGFYCPSSYGNAVSHTGGAGGIYSCPRGSYCHGVGSLNFTLCPRGTYQPAIGSSACLRCPIGFMCAGAFRRNCSIADVK